MEIVKYKPHISGALAGFFDLKIPKWGGIVIREMSFFQSNGKRWVGFPSKKVQSNDPSAKASYFPYLFFEDNNMRENFSKAVVAALDKYFLENQQKIQQEQSKNQHTQQNFSSMDEVGELPF